MISAEMPRISSTLQMLLPTTLPSARSGLPASAEPTDTAISGALVPKATTVRPTTSGETPKETASREAPRHEDVRTDNEDGEAEGEHQDLLEHGRLWATWWAETGAGVREFRILPGRMRGCRSDASRVAARNPRAPQRRPTRLAAFAHSRAWLPGATQVAIAAPNQRRAAARPSATRVVPEGASGSESGVGAQGGGLVGLFPGEARPRRGRSGRRRRCE